MTNSHTIDQTFKNGVVVDSLALKYQHIFKSGQKKFGPNGLQKQSTQESYGQPT